MIVETAKFKLKKGVTDSQFLAASQKAFDGFLSKSKGFVSRELVKSEDGTWMDIVHFETEKDAQEVFDNFSKNPSAKDFEAAIDPATASMGRFEVVKKYN